MEQSRIIYETLIGKRCSDSHWSRVKRLATLASIPLDRDGLKVIVELRKTNPRFFNLYPDIQYQLTNSQIGSDLGSCCSGEKLVEVIKNHLNLNPDKTTIYRWFYRSGINFKSGQLYDRNICMIILTNALIYKAKKQRLGSAK
jgi:hypothetical protein